jgi:hypothetical protein
VDYISLKGDANQNEDLFRWLIQSRTSSLSFPIETHEDVKKCR